MKKKEYLLALDVALGVTGATLFEIHKKKRDARFEKVMSIETGRGKTRPEKLNLFGKHLLEILAEYNIVDVAIESGFVRFHEATKAIFQTLGVAIYLMADISHHFYPPSTVKKVVAGKGNATKEDVFLSVEEFFPEANPKNKDESDSIAVGITHLKKKGYGIL